MDLPTCPGCGQSVLDEDAEDCPFCGASMKGGAGAGARHTPKPAVQRPLPSYARKPTTPPPPIGGSSPGARPASAGAGNSGSTIGPGAAGGAAAGRRSPIGQTVADEENPFDIDPQLASKAMQVAKTRTAQKSFKVVCPMCETAGFIPPTFAGKDVRCGNPQCMVPVFKAPFAPRKSSAETETLDKKSSTGMIVGILFALAALGGAAWFFLSPSSPGGLKKATKRNEYQDEQNVVDEQAEDKPDETPATEAPLTLAEVSDTTLAHMVAASQNPNQNRSKPFCRQATAETFAAVGQIDKAREQIERLRDVGKQLPFYQIMPLVSIAWQELKTDKAADANKSLDEAVALTKNPPGLPPYGSESLNIASSLSAVLAAAGRYDEAREILSGRTESGTLGDLVSWWREAFDSQNYDFEAVAADRALSSGAPPQWATVARALVLHGFSEAGLIWSEGNESPEIRVDCTIAWAEALVDEAARTQTPDLLAALEPAVAKLSPAGKARLYARLASRDNADTALVEGWAKIARDTLAAIKPAGPLAVPPMKELHRFTLPDSSEYRLAALASAELARVEMKLKQPAEAWASVNLALNLLRGTAPTVPAIQGKLDDIESHGAASIREQLKSALGLKNEDQAFQAFNEYRRNCESILKGAKACFRLQTEILIAAADWGLRNEVWEEARKRQIDRARPELYFATPLPAVLADDARRANETTLADKISAAVGKKAEGQDEADLRIQLEQTSKDLMKSGKAKEAAREIETFRRIDKTWRAQWMLRLLSSSVKAGEVEPVLEFIAGLDDQISRELLLEAMGALAARLDHGKLIHERIEATSLPSTEQVALGRGLILGLLAREPKKAP